MRLFAARLVVICVFFLTGCKFFRQTEEERYFSKVFDAMADQDWSEYEHLVTNRYKLLAREQSPNSFSAQGSYAHTELAPEESKRIKTDYQRAIKGGDNQIAFATESFERLKLIRVLSDDPLTEFGQGSIVPKLYSIETDKTTTGAEPRPPFAAVATSGGFVHFLGLVYPADQEEETEEEVDSDEP